MELTIYHDGIALKDKYVGDDEVEYLNAIKKLLVWNPEGCPAGKWEVKKDDGTVLYSTSGS